MKPGDQWDNSGEVEKVARALCDFEGRVPDKEWYGVAQWERYTAQAQTVLNALDGLVSYRRGVEDAARMCEKWAAEAGPCVPWAACHKEMARSIRELIKPCAARSEDQ